MTGDQVEAGEQHHNLQSLNESLNNKTILKTSKEKTTFLSLVSPE